MNELEIPCVVATTSAKELAFDNVSSVCVDDEAATMELVQYLTGYGHKDIVVMGARFQINRSVSRVILGVKKALKKVPDDISVVGFDGTVISRFYTPRITSMGQDINSIAKRSVELLMKHIHYTLGCEHDYAPHNLIEGESVRRV